MRQHHWLAIKSQFGAINTFDESKKALDDLVYDWVILRRQKAASMLSLEAAKDSIELWKSEAYSYANWGVTLHAQNNVKDQIIYTMGFALVMAFIMFPLLTISLMQSVTQ